MPDLAVLGFKVDARQLNEGRAALKGFREEGQRVKRATDEITQGTTKVGQGAARATASVERLRTSSTRLANEGKNATTVLGGMGEAADKAATSTARATAASNRLRDSSGRFVKAGKAVDETLDGIAVSAVAASTSVGTLSSLLMRLRTIIGPIAAMFAGAELFGSANQYVQLENSLKALGMSQTVATDKMRELAAVASDTRSSLAGTVQLYQRVSMAARDLGASEERAMAFTRAVGMAMAQAGQGGAAAEGAMIQLAQALGGTTIQAEEFNSLIDGAYPLVMAAARGIDEAGGSVGRLRQLVREGKVDSKAFFDAIISQTPALTTALANTTVTFGQAVGLFRDRLIMVMGSLDSATGFTETLARSILRLADALTAASKWLQEHQEILSRIGPYALAAAAVIGGQLVASFVAARVAMIAAAGAAVTFQGALVRTGIGAIVVLLGEITLRVMQLSEAFGGLRAAMSVLFDWWGNILAAGAADVRAFVYGGIAQVIELAISIETNLRRAANTAIGAMVGAYQAIKAAWSDLPGAIGDYVFQAAHNTVQGVGKMINAVIDKLNTFVQGLRAGLGKAIYDALPDVPQAIKDQMPWLDHFLADNPLDKMAPLEHVDLGGVANEFEGAAARMASSAREAYAAAAGQDYIGPGPVETWQGVADTYREAEASAIATGDAHRATAAAIKDGAQAVLSSVAGAAATAATNAGAMGDALDEAGSKGAKGGKKAADGVARVEKEIEDAQKAINEKLISAIESASNAFAEWTMRGFRDFKTMVNAIIDAFKNMLVELIAMAAKNRIMVQLGLDPLSQALGAAGLPVGGGLGRGGGLLSTLIGSFQPGAGGFLGGIGTVGRGIAGGWATGGLGGALSGGLSASLQTIGAGLGSGTLAGVATALGAAVPIIAGVAAVISIGKKLFGRTLKDTGIEATFSMAEGLAASTYKFYKGGLFRSDKTKRSPMDQEMAGPLERSMRQIGDSVMDMAESLGISGATLEGLTHKFKFSTKGLSESEIEAKLQEEFEKFGDAAASAAVKNLGDFLKQGEAAYEGLQRLSGALVTANDAMNRIGQTLFEVSLVGADMASQLADLFGGADSMAAAVGNYFEKFSTEARKREWLEESTADALAKVNVALPRTRDEYRALVDAQDLTTASGRKTFAALMSVADALDILLPRVSAFSQALMDAAGEVLTNIDLQLDYAKRMASEMRSAAKAWYDAARSIREQLREMFQDRNSGARPQDRLAMSEANYRRAFAAARGGDVEAAKEVAGLAKTYIENLRETAHSQREYARREAQIRSELGLLAGISELTGATKDVQATLYENMITVLEDLKTFINLQGLTEDELANFGEDIQDMFADFDGTIADFTAQLDSLSDAIEYVAGLNYDTLIQELKINVDVITAADLPNEIKQLLYGVNNGIRSTIDFVVRSDLPPDMKWLALTQMSEHAKTIKFIAENKLPPDLTRLAVGNVSSMLKTVNLVVGSTIPDDIKRIVLANSSDLARRLNVTLAETTDPAALRIALMRDENLIKRVNAIVETGRLNPEQLAFLRLVGGSTTGTVLLGGTFRFDPSGAFISWYGDATRNTITNPMNNLRASLISLRDVIAADAAARAAEAARRQRIEAAQAALGAIVNEQKKAIAGVNAGIADIWELAAKHNVSLKTEKGGSRAWFKVDENGRFVADYDAIGGSSSNIAAFKKEFYGTGSSRDGWSDTSTVSGRTYGQMDELNKLIRQIEAARAAVRALGGVPAFALGGAHSGGVRLVGERGPELEVTGPSRIWNANDTRAMLNPGVAEELHALREEVRRLREDNTTGQVQIAKNTRKVADMVRKWDVDGQPAVREEV